MRSSSASPGGALRLHLWPERTREHGTPCWPVHDHVWDLLSHVLCGELESRRYAVVDDPCGDAVLYAVRYGEGRSSYMSRSERRVSVNREGKPAHSIVRLHRRWQSCSLVEVELKTGRTHQIRVHLTHQGFPLHGDDKYGDFALNKQLEKAGLKRMFLHAAHLAFRHPLTDAPIELSAPLPDELAAFIVAVEQAEERDYG